MAQGEPVLPACRMVDHVEEHGVRRVVKLGAERGNELLTKDEAISAQS